MKKRILIGINNLSGNSIGISLISLLSNIDTSKYDIDLIFANSQTTLLNQIPQYVNIIYSPFNDDKIKFMDKLKLYHKYSLSLMYDFGSQKLLETIKKASKNSCVYMHRNLKDIYIVPSKLNQFIEENKIFDFKKIIFSNELLKESFEKSFPDEKNKHFVLEYVVNNERIVKLSNVNVEASKPKNTTLLFTAGTLNDRSKNYSLMIKMMANLTKLNNHVHLWILGDGPDLVNLKIMVKNYGLSDYVTLFGFKSNPYPYMKMADYIINTSETSDSSTTLIEARVLQKPIISTSSDFKNPNTYIVSADPNMIARQINNIILKKVIYTGNNNFWVENQKILKTFDEIVDR